MRRTVKDFKPETLLCCVYWTHGSGFGGFVRHSEVSVDMAVEKMPDPPITVEEMQSVAFAAKMALAKVLRARKGKS
jgi:hypothetical protein